MTAAVRNGALPDEALQASSNHRLEPREWDEKNVPSSSNPPSRTMAWKWGFQRSISPKVWWAMTMPVRSGLPVALA